MVNLLNPMLMGPAQSIQPPPPMGPQATAGAFPAVPVQSPVSGIGSRLRGLLAPEIALPMAAGLASGQTFGEGLGMGFAGAAKGMQVQRQQEQEAQQQSATRSWLASMGLSPPEVEGAMSNPAILTHYLKQAGADADGGASYSKTPVYMTDAEGNTVLGTIGDDASFKKIDTGGLSVASGVDKVDAGTKWLLYDKRTGQLVGEQQKENYQEAFDKGRGGAEGKAQGDATATYRSVLSKMPGLETVVQKLDDLSEKATYTLGGQAIDFGMRQAGLEPREAAVARAKYIAIVDNQILPLLRDTFGAQFTQKEGETLKKTLGDPDKSPKEKQAVLKAFIEQKRRNIEAMALETMQAVPPPVSGAPATSNRTSSGVQWSIE